jgi:hypothetical protein
VFYGGGGNCAVAKLNRDMVSINGAVQSVTNLSNFHEGTWIFKRNNLYYLTYADNNANYNELEYAVSTNVMGPWTSKGVYLFSTGCSTSQGSVVEYHGQWYQFYHNQVLSNNGCLRDICVDLLNFDANGNILTVVQTTNGPPANGPAPIAATNTIIYAVTNGTVGSGSVFARDGAAFDGWCVQDMHVSTNTFFELSHVDGGPSGGLNLMDVNFAVQGDGSKLLITVNGQDYSYINTLNTGGWSSYAGDSTLAIPLGPGTTNIVLFTGGNGGVNPDYVSFIPLPLPPWNAQIQNDTNFGLKSNQFGFDVGGANWPYVVDTATDINNPAWASLATNIIANGGIVSGTSYFSDSQWASHPSRFYRVRSP